jgi:exodeoxyribonuclease VII small subunit
MMEQQRAAIPDLPFGAALAELEAIVGELESGTLELEDSLDRYERGVALLRSLQSRLTEAQQKVTVLLGEIESDSLGGSEEGGEL